MTDLDRLTEAVVAAGPEVLLPPGRTTDPQGAVAAPAVVRDALPLPGGALLAVVARAAEWFVTPLVPTHDGVRRARAGDGAFEGVLALLAQGGSAGRFAFAPRSVVPRSRDERAIEVDQSNESVIVGERAVVKLFVRTAPGSQPGVDMPAHLLEAGFDALPTPYGSLTWSPSQGEPILLATAARYLPGARDGWDWSLDLARGWIESKQADDDEAFAPAPTLGRLIARLHVALGTPSTLFPDPIGHSTPERRARWRNRAESTFDDALRETAGESLRHLRARSARLRDALAMFDDVGTTPLLRVHGDLHVGQILAWDGGYAISDFDGNPVAPLEERTVNDAPARDVAAFVRSLDHVARIVQRDGGDAARATEWAARSRATFLDTYRAQLASSGRADLFEERLLAPFESAQACHEFVYAARYLPSWTTVADLALMELLPEASA